MVEDNRDAADSMAMLLRLCDFEIRVALDGPAALKEAETNPPNAVLLDIGLPGIDGSEVARKLRRQARTKRALIIAITGFGREEDQQLSIAAGIDLHLVKPVDPLHLEAILKKFEWIVQTES